MKKKRLDNPKKYFGNEVERYLGILHEEHMSALKGITEKFDIVDRRFDGVDSLLSSHSEMIGKIMEDVAILKGDVEIVKSGVKQKPDYKDFIALSRRVRVLESKVK